MEALAEGVECLSCLNLARQALVKARAIRCWLAALLPQLTPHTFRWLRFDTDFFFSCVVSISCCSKQIQRWASGLVEETFKFACTTWGLSNNKHKMGVICKRSPKFRALKLVHIMQSIYSLCSFPVVAAHQWEHYFPALLERRPSVWAWQQRLVHDMASSLFLHIRRGYLAATTIMILLWLTSGSCSLACLSWRLSWSCLHFPWLAASSLLI